RFSSWSGSHLRRRSPDRGWPSCFGRVASALLRTRGMTVTARTSGPLIFHLPSPRSRMSDEEFLAFCHANPELRIEQTAEGELIVMPPAGSETGGQNFTLAGLFFNWVRADGTGKGFD